MRTISLLLIVFLAVVFQNMHTLLFSQVFMVFIKHLNSSRYKTLTRQLHLLAEV